MNYLSVCSGIEAATVAWHPLGWNPIGFGEIEKFPSQVLAHHYPNTPNLGDMTKFKEWSSDSAINVLVGGTPCQSFSVAGLRKGLDDPRGNLMLTYLAIAAKYRPQWLVWENVPGVLSSNGGLDFASLLRGMGELGYGFAYRVLDAQYFGVAQRRRRVFVVGYLGNWQCAAAVLFERHSLCGYPAPSREKGKSVAPSVTTGAPFSRTGNDRVEAEAMVTTARMVAFGEYSDDGSASAMKARDYKDATDLVMQPISFDLAQITSKINRTKVEEGLPVGTLAKGSQMHVAQPIPIDTMNHIGRGDKHSFGDFVAGAPSYTLTKGHSHAVAQPVNIYGGNKRTDRPEGGFYVRMGEETSKTLDAASGLNPTCSQGGTAVMQPIAFSRVDDGRDATHNLAPTMRVAGRAGGMLGVAHAMAVRRLTPTECERLQGFPDGYTDIRHGGKSTPDGPRYKALGNSMAVPVMAWIGQRIQQVENIV